MAAQEHVSFATLLKQFRAASGLTQEGLAERAHLSREAVSALERGGRQYPRRDTLELLADALELGEADRAALVRSAMRPGRAREALDQVTEGETSGPRWTGTLPVPPTRLLGRDAELVQACSLITDDGVRLLTLTGPPGVGKTP
jgi:transcriptional regulator with XRE-family HTH domain